MSYDSIFKQNAAEDEAADWTRLDTSLHAATFAAQSTGAGSICPYCSASDDPPKDCALRPFSRATPSASQSQGGNQPKSHDKRDTRARAWPASFPICIRWNKGNCLLHNCRYRHSCATCPGSHQACACPNAPPGSFYKQNAPQLRAGDTHSSFA